MSINGDEKESADYQHYLEKIRDVQKAKGFDNHNMASRLGLSDQTSWSKIINGKTMLTLPLLLAIARVFEMSAPQLLNFDKSKYFSYCTDNLNVHGHNIYNAASAKERELYEARIKELHDQIDELKAEVLDLRNDKELLREELASARKSKR